MTTTFDGQNTPDQPRPDALTRLLARAYTLNWEAITYVMIFGMAVFSRFFMLGERAMSHDESLHTRYSYNLATEGNFQHTPLMHGPILFHFTGMFYFLFGANDFTSRLYTAILGVAVVMMPLLFRRWLGRWGAILSSIMLLISPVTLYYNRYIRHDTPNIFFSLLMIWGMFMYMSGPENQRRREHWLYLIAGAMIMNLGSKETAFIYIAIFGIYLALFWFVRMWVFYREGQARSAFYTIMMAFGVGGVAALGMFVTLSINLGEQPFFTAMETLSSPGTFISWTLVVILLIAILTAGTALVGALRAGRSITLKDGLLFFGLSFFISTILIWLEELSRLSHETGGTPAPVVPGEESAEFALTIASRLPIIALWGFAALVIGVIFIMWRRGIWQNIKDNFAEFDLIVLIGTLILPWATPAVIYATGMEPTAYTAPGYWQITIASLIPMAAMSTVAGLLWDWRKWTISVMLFYAIFAFFFTTMFTNPDGVGTGLIGSLGYWLEQQEVRRGNQPQYYYLTIILPMYEYLPSIGALLAMATGLTWFWRFRVTREGENAALREQMLAEAVDDVDNDDNQSLEPDADLGGVVDENEAQRAVDILKRKRSAESLSYMPFLPFVAWWGVWNLIGYTLAGEKMPWLAIHLTLPMILLTGWFFGRIFDRIDLRRFRDLGWVYLLLLPLLFVLSLSLVGPFIFGNVPFTGLSRDALSSSGVWIGRAAFTGLAALAVFRLAEHTGFKHMRHMAAVAFFGLMSIFTLRAAWMASFINYDLANEYLVYAHAAPAVKDVLGEIEELSFRTTDGNDLQFVYDNEVSWPYSWYFRDFANGRFVGDSPNAQQLDNAVVAVVGEANRSKFEPLLEDRFYRYEHIRLWWPLQDYFGLTPQRLANTFDPSNLNAPEIRRGIWEIWWNRDHSVYAAANNKTLELTSWPVSDRMHFYVRKDFASQIWNLGTGTAVVDNPLAGETVNVCNANWQGVAALAVYGEGQLRNPIDVVIADERTIIVADQNSHSVALLDPQTAEITRYGQQGSALNPTTGLMGDHTETLGLFERPHGVSLDAEGNIYVADTWNFRVQVLSPDGETLRAWGDREEAGASVLTDPVDGFWGPRDVLVDQGRVFVSDTGNKRIRAYDLEGNFRFDVGSAGSDEGQLNEPAGLAVDAAGNLYVADTWNRRISVFSVVDGSPVTSFRVRAWYDDRGNRPYLAVDDTRGYLYVGDPDGGRVLVYDLEGNCLGSFGQSGTLGESLTNNQFVTVGGLAVDDAGIVYVVDSGVGRILRFAPFELPPEAIGPDGQPMGEADGVGVGVDLDVGEEPVGGEEADEEAEADTAEE
jgi:uncharacterized protein (TIGR03663 family)